jgi:hypothetical protein
VDPSFFDALGIPFVAGRNFNDDDTARAEQVVIVNRHTADTLWPGREPIGQRLMIGSGYIGNVWRRVIGVVGDTKWHAAETGKGFEVYYTHRQYPLPAIHVLLRTANDPASLIPIARRVIHDVNPDIAINDCSRWTRSSPTRSGRGVCGACSLRCLPAWRCCWQLSVFTA